MAKRKPRFKKLIGFVYIAIGVFMLYSLIVSVGRVIEGRNELTILEAQRDALLKEKKELVAEVELLNDDDYVIVYARKHYIFTKEGEVVATLPESKK